MRALFIWSLILLLAGGSGCAWFEKKGEKSAEQLADTGMVLYQDGDYREAIAAFEKLRDWYPFSKFASLAELKIADAHYHLDEYEEAIFAYQEFENLHPRNEAIPYVIYQIGRCYFEQVDTVDRDQTAARLALESFQRLVRQYPEDAYAQKAKEHIRDCYKSLAGHEFYVGLFYYKSKHYKTALSRFKAVLTNYPDVGIHRKALHYIRLSEKALKEQQAQNDS